MRSYWYAWLAIAAGCGTVLLAARPAAESGRVAQSATGQLQLRVGTRPPITLLHRDDQLTDGRVLGVAWDRRIWYSSRRETAPSGIPRPGAISLLTSDGAAQRLAVLPKYDQCLVGAASPDGRYLAYATQPDNPDAPHAKLPAISVFLMKSNGAGKRQLATVPYLGEAGSWGYRLSWSPDSTHLAVPVREKGRNRIALISVTKETRTYLAVPDWADVTGPDWSPDGRSIAYSCEDRRWKPAEGEGTDWTSLRWLPADEKAELREGKKTIRPAAIWVTELRTGRSHPVTKTARPDNVDVQPHWSPGGTQLVYASWEWDHEFGDMDYWWLNLHVVQRDGASNHLLHDPVYHGETASSSDGIAQWLPDGRRLVFSGVQEGSEGRATGLGLVSADSKQGAPLTPGMPGYPSITHSDDRGHTYDDGLLVDDFALSPDGKYAVVVGQLWMGFPAGVWKVPLPPAAPAG